MDMRSLARRQSVRTIVLFTITFLLANGAASGQELIWEWQGQTGWAAMDDSFGASVSFVGDIDGDGVADAVVGVPFENVIPIKPVGAAYLFSGATGLQIRKHSGTMNYDHFGHAVAGGGDFDGDGVGDYIIGASEFNGPAGADSGAAYVYSGATGASLYSYYGESGGSYFGAYASVLGDLDGDGSPEFAVGSTSFGTVSVSGSGRAYVYSGGTGSLLYDYTGTAQSQNLGTVCRLGDLNGDGIGEIGVGSFGSGAGPNGEGQFEILDGPTGTLLHTLYGEAKGDLFAYGAGLGDVDGDGVDDFMVSALQHTTNPGSSSDREGRVYVYSGATVTLLFQYDGIEKDEVMGRVPEHGRIDFNGDGFDDILFGSPLRSTPTNAVGIAFAYSGRTGKLLYEFRGLDNPTTTTGGLGASLTVAGDMNHDGIDDLLVGAPLTWTGSSAAAGRACVFAGNDLFLQANAATYVPGDPVTIDLRGGAPGKVALIVVVDVNGTSLFEPILLGNLDPDGNLQYADVASSDYSGATVTLMGFAKKAKGRGLADSGVETIVFQ
jgi:hypothetical protein